MQHEHDDDVVKAVVKMQKSEFGLTGIKGEFEARLHRADASIDDEVYCNYCEEGRAECSDCDGDGSLDCLDCDGGGYVVTEHGLREDCTACEGGTVDCDCDEGFVTCPECDGNYQRESTSSKNWRDDEVVEQFLLEQLHPYKLAKRTREGVFVEVQPLRFSGVWADGGDTEWAWTIELPENHPEYVLHLWHIAEAWNKLREILAEESGSKTDLSNAGMHLSLLNSKGATYPDRDHAKHAEQLPKFLNFRKSMLLLLPALYFLGSDGSRSRSMHPRAPKISCSGIPSYDDKYSAIYFHSGALEFRVFDTCYDNPQQLLDNVLVMANCLKYWTSKYTRNYLDKVTKRIKFGDTRSRNDAEHHQLARFYVTTQHLELLNRGLALIKPHYYTIGELKKQRGFTYTKRHANNRISTLRKQAEKEFKEYQLKVGWQNTIQEHNFITTYLQNNYVPGVRITKEILAEAKKWAQEQLKIHYPVKDKTRFVEEKVTSTSGEEGAYELNVEVDVSVPQSSGQDSYGEPVTVVWA